MENKLKRKIVKIEQEKCNGCGLCIPNCPEGALQIIDGKARLISDLFCDGLGACIGYCPQGAIIIEERETEGYNEKKVMENIVKQGANTIKAHLLHLKDHGEHKYFQEAVAFLNEKGIENPLQKESSAMLEHRGHEAHGCPGSKMMDFRNKPGSSAESKPSSRQDSQLCQWPVQLSLVPPGAPYFEGADLAIVADCVPFAYANFHRDILRARSIVIACPKLDDAEFYKQKLAQIFKQSNIKSLTIVHMEVPCCFGLNSIVEEALQLSKKQIPIKEIVITIQGALKP